MNTPRRFDLVLGVKYCLIRLFTFYMIGILIQNVLCSCCFLAFGGFFFKCLILYNRLSYILYYLLYSLQLQKSRILLRHCQLSPNGVGKVTSGWESQKHYSISVFWLFETWYHYIHQAGRELAILPQFPKFWGYRYVPLCLASFLLLM